MEKIREYLKKPWVWGVCGLVIGLIFGWMVLGWGLFPVKWYDAGISNTRQDLQQEYLLMAVDSYSANKDITLAKKRWVELGDKAPEVLKAVSEGAKPDALKRITEFAAVVKAGAPVVEATPKATTAPEKTVAPAKKPISKFLPIMLVVCLLVLLAAGALVLIFVLRNRSREAGAAPAAAPSEAAPEAGWAPQYAETGEEPPMAQFMASYKLGDDLFDESFSIDSPSGEFLGECGVGISETIGVGDPKKVTAFEVWLFDKNDIQTVTKVVMSSHAFTDETIRQRLAAKGEPIQATPGTQVVLETATLQLVARVVDMAYGSGALPDQSFFENMVLELAVWQK